MKFESEQKPLIVRTALFLFLFFITTGILGSIVIPSSLLYKFNFDLYPTFGKLALICLFIFAILAKDKLENLKIDNKLNNENKIFYICFLLLIISFNYFSGILQNTVSLESNIAIYLITHVNLVLIPLFLFLSVFNLDFINQLIRNVRNETLICLGLGMILYFWIAWSYNLWPYLSQIVLVSVVNLLNLTYENITIFPPLTIVLEQFSVTVEKSCSGIESITLFTFLYGFIILLDQKKINIMKAILAFIPVLIGLFLLNILRVYLIVIIGIHFSPYTAMMLFHTYASMLIFLFYSGILIKYFYKHLRK